MFICRTCGRSGNVEVCESCGYAPPLVDGIYQLTDDPYIRLDGEGDKYIGYERVGEFYEGKRWADLDPIMISTSKAIIELTGTGPILDLGCGSGAYSVPLVLNGAKVIAADISNRMLSLLKKKARKNGCDLKRLTICRLNALSLPLADSSVGGAVINSVLHLISNPQKVIDELLRVLMPGAYLVLSVNSPGLSKDITDELFELNKVGYAITNEFHHIYWSYLSGMGVSASRLSWQFDQFDSCRRIFGNSDVVRVPFYERRISTLADGFLHRMGGKGFSDQQNVDEESHRIAFNKACQNIQEIYGEDFASTPMVEITDGVNLQVYRK